MFTTIATGTVGDATVETETHTADGPQVIYRYTDFAVTYNPNEARALAYLLLQAADDADQLGKGH